MEHLEQDVKSKAKPPFQFLLQPSCQLLSPISAKHLEREDVKSKAKSSSEFLLLILTDYFEKNDTRSKDKSMDHISLMKTFMRRTNKNAGIVNKTTLVKQVLMNTIHASWMNLYTLPLKHSSHAMMSLETIFKIYAMGITWSLYANADKDPIPLRCLSHAQGVSTYVPTWRYL